MKKLDFEQIRPFYRIRVICDLCGGFCNAEKRLTSFRSDTFKFFNPFMRVCYSCLSKRQFFRLYKNLLKNELRDQFNSKAWPRSWEDVYIRGLPSTMFKTFFSCYEGFQKARKIRIHFMQPEMRKKGLLKNTTVDKDIEDFSKPIQFTYKFLKTLVYISRKATYQ